MSFHEFTQQKKGFHDFTQRKKAFHAITQPYGGASLKEYLDLNTFPSTLLVESFAGRNFSGDKLSRTQMVKIKLHGYNAKYFDAFSLF